jgi:hypothetical protein
VSLSANELGCFTTETLVTPSIAYNCSADTLSGPGPDRPHAGEGLPIRGRSRGVEFHVAFDFLHDLMDVNSRGSALSRQDGSASVLVELNCHRTSQRTEMTSRRFGFRKAAGDHRQHRADT